MTDTTRTTTTTDTDARFAALRQTLGLTEGADFTLREEEEQQQDARDADARCAALLRR